MKMHTDTDTYTHCPLEFRIKLGEGELVEVWRNEIRPFVRQSLNPCFGFQNYDSEALLILVCLVPELCSYFCACLVEENEY